MATTTNTIPTLTSWGEVEQKTFYNGKEVVKQSKKVIPKDGAVAAFNYTNKAGNKGAWYNVEDVTIIDTLEMRERERAARELFKQFMAHELTATQYAEAIAALEA